MQTIFLVMYFVIDDLKKKKKPAQVLSLVSSRSREPNLMSKLSRQTPISWGRLKFNDIY